MTGTHDAALVALSILIATIASYTALDLVSRAQAARQTRSFGWLAAASIAMGGGIWSMHFIGMLAFSLPGMPISYDVELTLISLLVPIVVTGTAFAVLRPGGGSRASLAICGLGVGVSIIAMHYVGMAAMRMPEAIRYEASWTAIAVMIALGASTLALWLAFKEAGLVQRLAAACAMGLAVSGMHYAAMAGARFDIHAGDSLHGHDGAIGQTAVALSVAAATFLILLLSLIAAMFDRRFAVLAAREAEALRLSEEKFRLLLRSVTDYAIFMLDKDGRVASWNAGAERIKGYRAEEIIGSHISHFYTAEDRDAGWPELALRTAAEVGKFGTEGWRVRRDGSLFWASVVLEAIRDDAGELVGFAKVTRDTTERKHAQEALQSAQEALAQSRKMEALGQLTGGVAHDFNNLLTIVMGSMELLRKRLPDDPKLRQLAENAFQAAQRGSALTQRMLAFARKQELRPVIVDLAAVARGMADLLSRTVDPAVRIEFDFSEEPALVLVDPHQLELAILNLCVNARDAMPDGGKIVISTRREVDAASGQAFAALSVIDDGQGMDAATLERAREPFFTTKAVGKGTGLGLSMIHGLAEQSHGRLLLKSREGEGTTAELWFPAAPASTGTTDETAASSSAAARRLRVLAVDDDPLVLENTVAMLEDLGHTVWSTTSPDHALGLLAGDLALDILVTDQAMPGLTGVELIKRAHHMRPGTPALLVSGYAQTLEADTVAVTRLQKPFTRSALEAAIIFAVARPS